MIDQNNKHGGLSLEAALIMPLVLMLTASLVVALYCFEAQIKIKGAMDRTAAELSLLSPACQLLEELNLGDLGISEKASELNTVIEEICPGESIESIMGDAMLDLASSVLVGKILQNRLDYWLGEAWSGQPGWAGCLGRRKLYLDWKTGSQQLWLCLSYQLKTPIGTMTRQANVVVPLWTGQKKLDSDEDADGIWQLDNFSRGRRLRELYGANLPYDFPVIARFSEGEALSIKSIDLTAPTYQDQETIRENLLEQIENLFLFNGADYYREKGSVSVSSQSITSRRLLLIIPGNCQQPWIDDFFMDMSSRAAAKSITLQIVRFGSSTRYRR